MCQAVKPIRNVVLFEGQVKWIMERETAEERLAAWEALAAIAFPDDEEHPYTPPPIPLDGSKLTPCDKARRDVYNLFKDLIESRAVRSNGKLKDLKKVEAGRLGAAMRFGKKYESTAEDTSEEIVMCGAFSTDADGGTIEQEEKAQLPAPIVEDDFSSSYAGKYKHDRTLTKEDKNAIAEWDRKIPDAEALREYLAQNYLYQNKSTIITEGFCRFAYHKLAKIDRWLSTRDKKPLRDIRQAIHYLALDYIKKTGEIRRAEKAEECKDKEFAFEMKSVQQGRQSTSELATIERKRRRAAEKAAAEKIIRGEL